MGMCRISDTTPDPLNQDLQVNKIPRVIHMLITIDKYCLTVHTSDITSVLFTEECDGFTQADMKRSQNVEKKKSKLQTNMNLYNPFVYTFLK